MTWLLAVLQLLAGARLGTATTFYPVERWNNGWAACLRRPLTPEDVGVAHPSLPCRSWVWVYNVRNGRSARAQVIDRGPRHVLVDLTRPLARTLATRGRGNVLLVPLPDPPTTPAPASFARR